jgi:FkbM family methyltransferase
LESLSLTSTDPNERHRSERLNLAQAIQSPRGVARSISRHFRRLRSKYAEIGPYKIHLPAQHEVLEYKRNYHLYDTALAKIAGVLRDKYADLHAIDIGANIGDTAALIRESGEIPVLCIEGDPLALPFLRENAMNLGDGIEIEPSFVGKEGMSVDLNSASNLGFNASLIAGRDKQGEVELRPLSTILVAHPRFKGSKLLKTDTEGFDFDILRLSMSFIRQAKPVIFFEYGPHLRQDEPLAGLDTIAQLISAGYSDFIYYDNFGNFLLHVEAKSQSIMNDLDSYLGSNRRHGLVVHYFDICALHQEDADMVSRIKSETQR